MKKEIKFNSVSEILSYIYNLSLNQSSFRFRGQADYDWPLKPSIYRYNSFKRYQTVDYENNILSVKPKSPQPPLTHTNFDLEWLMLCQHYGIPTRLVDWTMDVLVALFFACHGNNERNEDGALFICNKNDYDSFSAFEDKVMKTQKMVFVNTSIINPRMRAQSGCFMLWGHSPLDRDVSTESYDIWQYQDSMEGDFFLEKLCIQKESKKIILRELNQIYSITSSSLYLRNGYLEKNFGKQFKDLKEQSRLMTLYRTDADRLSTSEEKKARSYFKSDCRTMFGNCVNLSNISMG
jgi:hypothetical protein